jgi:hypothetical protein
MSAINTTHSLKQLMLTIEVNVDVVCRQKDLHDPMNSAVQLTHPALVACSPRLTAHHAQRAV